MLFLCLVLLQSTKIIMLFLCSVRSVMAFQQNSQVRFCYPVVKTTLGIQPQVVPA